MDEIDNFVVLGEVEVLAEDLRRRRTESRAQRRDADDIPFFAVKPVPFLGERGAVTAAAARRKAMPSKYEPTSETPLRHAPRRDMFPSPDKEFIINRRRRRK